jgi:integrase
LKLDGMPAAASTVARKRAIFYNVLQYAVELEELDSNPIDRVRWKPVKVAESVDPRVVINPQQAAELLAAVTYIGSRGGGRRLMALYACMYYGALRPAEAVALRKADCHLPEQGWGKLTLSGSRPEVNTRWTDSGSAHEQRQLKHRARQDLRVVPPKPCDPAGPHRGVRDGRGWPALQQRARKGHRLDVVRAGLGRRAGIRALA